MTAILTDEGQDDQLNTLIVELGADLRIFLYKALSGSGKGVTWSDFTPANYSGYAEQTPAWSLGAIDGAGRSTATDSPLTFTHNGGGTSNNVIGYGMRNNSTGKVEFYEPFSAPVVMAASGNVIVIGTTWYYGDLDPPL